MQNNNAPGNVEPTSLAKGSFRIRRSVLFWYFLISLRATVPGRYLRFFPCGTGSPAARAKNGCQ